MRGPDLLWGGDIRTFHPPAGKFDGVIGGPPCKGESNLAYLNGKHGESLWGEAMRVIEEARPAWWVLEAVKKHEAPFVVLLSPRWLGEKQSRRRYFHSNLNLLPFVEVALFEHPEKRRAVLGAHGGREGTTYRRMTTYSWAEMCELQGLPEGYDLPFTRQAKREAVGNGVPLSMGRAIAKAVKAVVSPETKERHG